jgi:hypothetical protein
MSKVFKVWPKRVKRVNGTVLTPDMVIIVTTKIHVSNPFSNGAQEIKDTYMRIYQFDYKKANCYQSDFNYVALCLSLEKVDSLKAKRDVRVSNIETGDVLR